MIGGEGERRRGGGGGEQTGEGEQWSIGAGEEEEEEEDYTLVTSKRWVKSKVCSGVTKRGKAMEARLHTATYRQRERERDCSRCVRRNE